MQDERELSNKLKSFYKNSNDLKFCFSIESIKLAYNDIFIYHREILDRYKNGKHKGIKWITSLNNKKDVELVKLYINDGIEIRHVKDLFTNSFILSDKEILLSTIKKKEKETIVTNFLSRNDKIYLNYYNAIFEDLWKEGININEKITDIEAGHYVNVKIILNPKESLKIINEFVYKKTKKELLLILSSTNAFFRIENNNDFVSLEKLTDQRIAVKVLIPEKKELKYKIEQIKMKYSKIEFREFNTYHEPFIGIIIIDRENVLLIEIKDDIKKDYINSLGLTIIIEGNSAALSYFSIFESLWKQTELYLQLQRNDSYKSEFLSMLSHELKTPLVPIKGYTEMLLKPHLLGDLNNNQIKAIQSIYRNIENLESLIQNILYIYSLESKKTTITKKNIKINKILDDVINDLKPSFEQKNISVVSEINAKISNTIYCDAKRIEQVLLNLIINSIDFVPKDIGKITISIKEKENLFSEKGTNHNDNKKDELLYWEFTIKDNGIGVPIDKFDLLFTKFYMINTSANRKFGGSGLGLAICKDIVEAHGGKIWLDKNYKNGTSIKFTIPKST